MKNYITFAFAFLTATSFADSLNKDAWLTGKLYGNDNNMASLRTVTIKEVENGYKIKIDNQFAFECDLNFGSDGQPHELKSCVSTLKEGDKWYDPRISWSVSPESIALQCTSNKKEYVCKGKYVLINQNYSSESEFTIARKKIAVAAEPAHIEGEYECDDCFGFLNIKHLESTKFQVWFGVGYGSCGSEPPLIRKVKYVGGGLKLHYKVEQKQCTTQIKFTDGGALITDSCFTAQDMADSTCATLGSYTKRK